MQETVREIFSQLWMQCLIVFFAFHALLNDLIGISNAFGCAVIGTFLFFVWRDSVYKFLIFGSIAMLVIIKLFYIP